MSDLNSRPLAGIKVAGWEVHEIVLRNGKTPVAKFLSKISDEEKENFAVRIERFVPWNETTLFKFYDGIWQVATYDHRILGFRSDALRLVLTNGFKKTRGQTPREEVEKCQQLKSEYLATRGSKS